MSHPQIIIESTYSIERRRINQRCLDIPPQADFLIVHFIRSHMSGYPSGTSMLVNPHCAVRITGRQSELLLVRLRPDLLIETAARLKVSRIGTHLLFRHPFKALMEDDRLRGTLESISGELKRNDAGWHEIIRSQINQLTVYLLRSHFNFQKSDEMELSRAGIIDRRLRRAIEFMHDNCGRELKLSEIAATAYISEFHFARLFKKITGMTPHGYLASLRIEKARRMLAETDLSISEIGAQIGYASQSHFTKIFREATGMTPRAFRIAVVKG